MARLPSKHNNRSYGVNAEMLRYSLLFPEINTKLYNFAHEIPSVLRYSSHTINSIKRKYTFAVNLVIVVNYS